MVGFVARISSLTISQLARMYISLYSLKANVNHIQKCFVAVYGLFWLWEGVEPCSKATQISF
jgi:hypothetical protein